MFMLRNTTGAGRKLVPCSRGECSYPQAGKKGQRLFGNDPTVFQTCVLGLSLQGWISIQNRPPLTMKWDCLISLPHRVIRATILFINLDVCLEDLPCLDSSCLPRMVNQLESGKLKFESKDLLFIAFQQRKPEPLRNLHSLAKVV